MNRGLLLHAICGLASLLLATTAGSTEEPRMAPLSVRDVVATRTFTMFSPVQLSPDGRWVAYTITDPQLAIAQPASGEAATRSVWVSDTRSGHARNISGLGGNGWNGIWSPDGTRLAFLSDRSGAVALWIWELATDRLRQAAPAQLHATSGIEWADDQSMVIKVAAEKQSVELSAATENRVDSTEPGDLAPVVLRSTAAEREFGATAASRGVTGQPLLARRGTTDLAVIDLRTEKVRRLSQGVDVIQYAVAPDGHSIAYMTRNEPLPGKSALSSVDIAVVAIAGGTPRVVARNVEFKFPALFTWSPDATQIAYPAEGSDSAPQLVILRLDSGASRIFAMGAKVDDEAANGSVRTGRANATPLWNEASDTIISLVGNSIWRIRVRDSTAAQFTMDGQLVLRTLRRQANPRYGSIDGGRSALVMVRDAVTQEEGIAAFDTATGSTRLVTQASVHYGGYGQDNSIDISADGRRAAFIRETSEHAPDIWVADSAFRSAKRVTQINPVFDRYSMGKARLIAWPGRNGQTLYGALLLPPTHRDGQRHPLVVVAYGGVFLSRRSNSFGLGAGNVPTENYQLLATQGIAVLMPDVPVGYGDPMADIAAGIDAAIERAIELGVADPKRLGITGHSYGGYSTLAAIVTNPDRFAAAVARASPANLLSQYGTLDESGESSDIEWSETGQGRMGGSLWEYRDRYINNSPVLFLEKVQTPLLILHGMADDAVLTSETAQVFVGLRRLDKTVEYVRYPGEDHWEADWTLVNQVDYWERMLRWFKHYLGVSPS